MAITITTAVVDEVQAPLALDDLSYSVNGGALVPLGAGVGFVIPGIADDASVRYVATKAGYRTLDMTFDVYDLDIAFNIMLVPDAVTTAVAYGDEIWNPCTFTYDIYNTSSANFHHTEFYLDGGATYEFTTHGRVWKECFNKGDRDVDIRTVNYVDHSPCAAGALVELNSDTFLLEFTVLEIRPSLTFTAQPELTCDFDDECPDTIPIDSNFLLVAFVDWNYGVGGVTCTSASFTWDIIDSDGNTFFTATTTWDPTVDPTPTNQDITDLAKNVGSWTQISAYGEYTIRGTITNCCSTCVVEKTIYISDDVQVVHTGTCHEYKVNNCKGVNITTTLLDETGATVSGPDVIASGDSQTYTTPNDGVYHIKVEEGGEPDRFYTVIDYCDIRTCYLTEVKESVCNCDCERCKDWDVVNKRRSLLAKYVMIYLQLKAVEHKLGYENRFFNAFLDGGGNLIDPIDDAQTAITMLTDYCACLAELRCSNEGCASCS